MKGDKLIDDRYQILVNLVRLKSHGLTFEVAIDPDKAVEYKEGGSVAMREIFKADAIFTDAKKGYVASDDDLMKVFGTTDVDTIKKKLLDEGEIQFTQEYREELKQRRERNVLHMLHRNTINPRTGTPHPETRLEAAMEEAKVNVDHMKKAADQMESIVKKLTPVIPISYERMKVVIHIPSSHVGKLRGFIEGYGKISHEDWLGDGSLRITLQIPAGLRDELMEALNNKSHGSCTLENTERIKM